MVPDVPREIVVVLDERGGGAADLQPYGDVVHVASPRVVVLRVHGDGAEAGVRGVGGVRWAGTAPPGPLRERLTGAERLFLDGWLLRTRGPTARRGDGRDWDAAGFTAPDRSASPDGR